MARISARSAAALISPLHKGRTARHVLYLIGDWRSVGSFLGIIASHVRVNSKRSFDDLVGGIEQSLWHLEAECHGGLYVDQKVKFHRLLHRQLRRRRAP